MPLNITESQLAEHIQTLDQTDQFKDINARIKAARILLRESNFTISDSNLVNLNAAMQRIENLTSKRNPDGVCELIQNELLNFEAVIRLENLKKNNF